jgi:clan AA aspartic protease
MIVGIVNTYNEAIIHLSIRGPQGQNADVHAVIDTGFSGWLSLPYVQVAQLGLPFRRRGRALLADGSETIFDVYEGMVLWDGNCAILP